MTTDKENNTFDDLSFDDLEKDSMLDTENFDNLLDEELDNLDDLDFNLDFDDQMNLNDDIFADENANNISDEITEQDSGDIAPAAEDVIDLETDSEESVDSFDLDESLSDDDLDLSLEANYDTNVISESNLDGVSADISDDDLVNFDESQYEDVSEKESVDFDLDQLQESSEDDNLEENTLTFDSDVDYGDDIDDEDDEDDDDYGVDLKTGPVTIEFTRVILPEQSPIEEETQLDEVQDLSSEPEEVLNDNIDFAEDEESYDINNDDDLEFEVTADTNLNNIDIDNVLDSQKDEGMLNINIPKRVPITVDEEQDDYLNGELDESLLDSQDADLAEPILEEDEVVLPEGNELDGVDNVESNFISDDDLSALGLDTDNNEDIEDNEQEATEASLAQDIVIDEEIDNPEDDKIVLDGDEDLGFDLNEVEAETPCEETNAEIINFDSIDDNTTAMNPELDMQIDESLDENICADVDLQDEVDETFDEQIEEEGIITDEIPTVKEITLNELDTANSGIVDDGSVMNVDIDDIPAPNLTETDDDDETIALSGDELDNILTSTDFSPSPEEQELTEEEREAVVAIPDDPGFENDDSIVSDEELAASVTLPEEEYEDTVASNDILNNGDLDNYEDVTLPEELDDIEALADEVISEENVSDQTQVGDELTEIDDNSETIDLSSFDAQLEPIDENVDFGVSDEAMDAIANELEDTKIDISPEDEAEIYGSIEQQINEEQESTNDAELKQDIKGVLSYLDQLLDCLPEEKIKEFAESKTFETYRKLFEQLDIKH